jgi:type II secretion system protein G
MVRPVDCRVVDQFGLRDHMKNAGRFYLWFVMLQAAVLFIFMGLSHLVPRQSQRARSFRARAEIMGHLKTVLEIFKTDCGRYPTMAEGWKVMVSPPVDGSLTNWGGPYLDLASGNLEDPWGHEYVYRFPAVYSTNGYDLYSLGPDGKSASGGNDPDDIDNWGKPLALPVTLARLIDESGILLLLIPLLFVAGMIGQLTVPDVREASREYRWVDWLWLVISVVAFYFALLRPRISG